MTDDPAPLVSLVSVGGWCIDPAHHSAWSCMRCRRHYCWVCNRLVDRDEIKLAARWCDNWRCQREMRIEDGIDVVVSRSEANGTAAIVHTGDGTP